MKRQTVWIDRLKRSVPLVYGARQVETRPPSKPTHVWVGGKLDNGVPRRRVKIRRAPAPRAAAEMSTDGLLGRPDVRLEELRARRPYPGQCDQHPRCGHLWHFVGENVETREIDQMCPCGATCRRTESGEMIDYSSAEDREIDVDVIDEAVKAINENEAAA